MITLYQFPTGLGIPNLSPFCMKVEVWLRLAKLDYKTKAALAPQLGPLGKLPYIKDNGHTVPDSSNIIDYLQQTYRIDLDLPLTVEQRVVARAFVRMLEEHTYWGLMYSRWLDPTGWPVTQKVFFGGLPPGARQLVSRMVQRKMRRDLYGQGLGRHPAVEIYHRTEQDLDLLAVQLGDKSYFMGNEPTTADATVYAWLANMWIARLDTPLKAMVGKHKNLVAYCERMRERCFPERK